MTSIVSEQLRDPCLTCVKIRRYQGHTTDSLDCSLIMMPCQVTLPYEAIIVCPAVFALNHPHLAHLRDYSLSNLYPFSTICPFSLDLFLYDYMMLRYLLVSLIHLDVLKLQFRLHGVTLQSRLRILASDLYSYAPSCALCPPLNIPTD